MELSISLPQYEILCFSFDTVCSFLFYTCDEKIIEHVLKFEATLGGA